MPVLFVARSVKLGRWASDVGLGKHVYKVGLAEDDPKTLAAAGWAGETDWKIVRSREVEGVSEEDVLERLARKERMLDPNLYPKVKGQPGFFRLRAKPKRHASWERPTSKITRARNTIHWLEDMRPNT